MRAGSQRILDALAMKLHAVRASVCLRITAVSSPHQIEHLPGNRDKAGAEVLAEVRHAPRPNQWAALSVKRSKVGTNLLLKLRLLQFQKEVAIVRLKGQRFAAN